MQRLALPYSATGQFKPIVLDYLQDEPKVHPFRVWPFNRAASEKALTARHFDPGKRTIVIAAIRRQYDGLSIPPQVEEHLQRLAEPDTYTVTTGHQLCLFGGPLFVLFKILNTVRLARELSTPQRTVVPVFWMASEDHDLAEVDHVFLRGTLVHWPAGATGAVGRIPLSMIDEVVSRAIALLGDGSGAAEIAGILRSAYQDGKTLAQATRIFIDGLFGRFGVVVVDGDDPTLKRLFAPLMQEELLNEVVARSVHYAEQQMPVEYAPQAHAREVNLFHLSPGRRARLVREGDGFRAMDGGPAFSTQELLDHLERSPEAFSPNVLLRPLYQESVLPNTAYVGGGGRWRTGCSYGGSSRRSKCRCPWYASARPPYFYRRARRNGSKRLALMWRIFSGPPPWWTRRSRWPSLPSRPHWRMSVRRWRGSTNTSPIVLRRPGLLSNVR
ncbi:MAG: bacillithiol biosynthesis cysteine-adding enzyme BshC [Flavobacteriales bacterium]|nr:bacillithiol biosynthesis cysteine-adding enzyme BshC [Flavobacteriales bacterium]